MPQIDIQASTAALIPYDIHLTTTANTYPGHVLPMTRSQQGIMVGFTTIPSYFDPADDIRYFFMLSDGVNEWPVPQDAILPSWNHQYHNKLYGAEEGKIEEQTAGFVGNAPYWQLILQVVYATIAYQIVVTPFAMQDAVPFTGWSDLSFPADGRP